MEKSGIALVVESLKEHALLAPFQHFKTTKYVKDSADGPSIIFPECQPSLAAVVVDGTLQRPLQSVLQQMEAVQGRFKNAYAVLVQVDEDRFAYLQLHMPGGQLRMLRVGSAAEGGRLLMSIYLALKDAPKLRAQREFFANQEAEVVSVERAQHIARSTFSNLGVPAADARDALWVRPDLVGEVEFAEFTPGGILRQARWRGLRPDKDPAEVVRED
jgi:hypothetical protein